MPLTRRAEEVEAATPFAPLKATPPHLDATMSVNEAFAAIVQSASTHMEANEPGVLAGQDAEFLHQMRVAVRRLRSAFSIFPDADERRRIATEMKWLAGRLGEARDWDVFVLQTLPRINDMLPEQSGMAQIRRLSARRRAAARRKAQATVASARYRALKLQLHRAAAAQAPSRPARSGALRRYAEDVLKQRYAKVCKRGRALQKQSWDDLHRLRISVKKLRYPVEFFQTLFEEKAARELRSQLARLQEVLGIMNDGATTQQLVRDRLRGESPELASAAAAIAGWAEGRSSGLRRELASAWKSFRAAKVFW